MIGTVTTLGNITTGLPGVSPHFQWWNYAALIVGGTLYAAIVGVMVVEIYRKIKARIGRRKHG